jgi:hypothetical protein
MKRLIPVIFVALGALVTACDSFRAGVFEDEMVMPLEGSEADSLFYKVSIQYASKGMLIPAMEKMNAAIVAQAFDMEGVDIGPLEETAAQYRENLIDEYLRENEELVGGTSVLSWADELTGTFGEDHQGWRNYTINYYSFRGGAHGYTSTTPLVFDSKTGELVLEADLFRDGYEEPLSELMQKKVTEFLKGEDESLLSLVEMSYVEPNENFSVGPDGVQWLFQADEIWPHAFGPLTVTLSWDELAPFLKK